VCGIAGFSFTSKSRTRRTFCAQALLAGIAERGADAVGYAFRASEGPADVVKQRSGASELLDRVHVPEDVTQALVHVRDYTKGHPRVAANNHPVRHGAVVGVHNGIIFNDDELFAARRIARHERRMTVDSEIIFALAELSWSDPAELEHLRGSMAAAWIDEREPGLLHVARGSGRPVWLGFGASEVLFASTERALGIAARFCELELETEELEEGTLLTLCEGREVRRERFAPDRAYEEELLPAVRAPREGDLCLARLAALAAPA
jgi:glucosamine 6-phosphate synthetase-like amidotransferase/phosphosugar isomerase protein